MPISASSGSVELVHPFADVSQPPSHPGLANADALG